MSAHSRLGEGGEFDRLRAIFRRLGSAGHDLGDDCALIRVGRAWLAVSIDLSLEGVHFRTDWLSFREIGWRSAAAALSDLAAEGADPIGVLVSLGVPGNRQRRTGNAATEIMAGVGAAVKSVGGSVLGGDLVRSQRYIVDVCVLGWAPRPVRRDGARPGDGLWVTGALGGARAALRSLVQGRRRPLPAWLRRFAHPEPRIAAGRRLAELGARAMIDISDGLAADAAHLAAASGVRVEIALEQVPCVRGVDRYRAAASGEEFELCAALPSRFRERDARAFRRRTGVPLTRIGRCARGSGVLVTDSGRPIAPPAGYDHFSAG
jgi:thiamine-monophosphate kinase